MFASDSSFIRTDYMYYIKVIIVLSAALVKTFLIWIN